MGARVFIDGEAGTTGLQIRDRLEGRPDLELLSIAEDDRKDVAARAALLNAADVVVLCLPDEAAKAAVGLIENPEVKVIDASTAHRTAPGWIYGFPELSASQRALIQASKRIANPGCYATGAIALIRPLRDAGLLPADWPLSLNAVSGYTGGGRGMIAEFEDLSAAAHTDAVFRLYGLGLDHKHLPEIKAMSGLEHTPIFVPAVGRFRQGMIVQAPLPLWALPGQPSLEEVHAALSRRYEGCRFVEVAPLETSRAVKTLNPEALCGGNLMRLHVFGRPEQGLAVLTAVLDNLGKGAAGAATQNLNLLIGAPEDRGL